MVCRVDRRREGRAVRAVRLCALAAMAIVLAACTVARGGPEPLDALSLGTLDPVAQETPASATPAIFAVAARALALGESEWLEAGSGAWGTVRRTGPDDERACTPAELVVHDYRGVRVENHDLCPTLPGP